MMLPSSAIAGNALAGMIEIANDLSGKLFLNYVVIASQAWSSFDGL